MVSTSGRLLQMLSLLQAAPHRSGPELAERLGVTDRTVRRDVERLRQLGYPVEGTSGVGGAYRLGAGAEVPPLLFDDDEAVALAVALGTAEPGPEAPIADASMRALAKVEHVLPPRLRHQVATVRAMTVTVTPEVPSPLAPAMLATLANACRERLVVRFGYVDREGAETQRRVEPLRLVSKGRRWYLVGYDLDRDDWRTFRLDRATLDPPGGHRFVVRPVPGGDIDHFVTSSLAMPEPFALRVRFGAPAAQVATAVSSRSSIVESDDDSSCTVVLRGTHPAVLAAYVGMIGIDFEVLDGDGEVIAAVRALQQRWTNAYPGEAGAT